METILIVLLVVFLLGGVAGDTLVGAVNFGRGARHFRSMRVHGRMVKPKDA